NCHADSRLGLNLHSNLSQIAGFCKCPVTFGCRNTPGRELTKEARKKSRETATASAALNDITGANKTNVTSLAPNPPIEIGSTAATEEIRNAVRYGIGFASADNPMSKTQIISSWAP